MATQNIIQYLETGVGIEAMNRRQVETFISGAAIAANDLVCLDLSKSSNGDKAITIIKADGSDVTKRCVVGFALEAATAAGQTVDVTIAGIHKSANVAAVNKGDSLSTSGTAGRADAYVAGDTVPVIAFALENHSANVAPVFVLKQF